LTGGTEQHQLAPAELLDCEDGYPRRGKVLGAVACC